ncbi:MAG: hypothetical protein HY731_08840 [Candidatus Tectomicrobia bacterium]|nr:hypothetical protein [Candidatus Tectomicrobia bacterium]
MRKEIVAPTLTFRQILLFAFPLALSGIMMNIGQPIINAAMTRLPEPEVTLAAYGVAYSLALLLESPVIMILLTAVALAKDEHSYRVIHRFMMVLCGILTALSLFITYTPLSRFLMASLMGVPPHLVEAALPGLKIFAFWPAVIGWRRFHEGVLINFGQTGRISIGTGYRLVVIIGLLFFLGLFSPFSGVVIGSLCTMAGVTFQAFYIHWHVLAIKKEQWDENRSTVEMEPLTYGKLIRFHLPLVMTSIMRNLSRPIIIAGIARGQAATLSLAAWPVANNVVSLLISPIGMLQEVSAALVNDDESLRRVRRFVTLVGFTLLLFLLLLSFTPLVDLLLITVMGVSRALRDIALPAVRIMACLPMINALDGLFRGLLSLQKRTQKIQSAMIVNLLSVALIVALGVWWGKISGITIGAIATVASAIIEALYLWRSALQGVFLEPIRKTTKTPRHQVY